MISVWDCHLIHGNAIGLLSTSAMKCLHWSLLCQKILSENFRTNFPSTFCKRTSFQSAIFNVGAFPLGPIFPYTVNQRISFNLGYKDLRKYRICVNTCKAATRSLVFQPSCQRQNVRETPLLSRTVGEISLTRCSPRAIDLLVQCLTNYQGMSPLKPWIDFENKPKAHTPRRLGATELFVGRSVAAARVFDGNCK